MVRSAIPRFRVKWERTFQIILEIRPVYILNPSSWASASRLAPIAVDTQGLHLAVLEEGR